MIYINSILLLFLFIPLSADAKTGPDLQNIEPQESTYTLITLPSVKKIKVEGALKRIKSTIPEAEIREITKETVVYRLVAKCFENRASAKSLQTTLTKSCRSPFVALSENSYCVVVSSQMSYSSALADQKVFAKKHISTSIVKTKVPLTQWQVAVGDYSNLKDSVINADKMSSTGLVTTIEPHEKKPVNKSKATLYRLMSEEIDKSYK